MKNLSFLKFLKVLVVVVVLTAAIMGGLIWYASQPPKIGGDFQLKHKGQEWIFSQHKKPLNLLYVGYVKCPDVCPMSLSFAAQAFKRLSPAELDRVQLIFISVDPEHDTDESVSTYATQFFPSFIGLTGAKEQIDQAIGKFGASYIVEANAKSYLGYSIAHTDRLFFLNSKGQVIDTIPNPRSDELIFTKIKENL